MDGRESGLGASTRRDGLTDVAACAVVIGTLLSFVELQVDSRGHLDVALVWPYWIGPASSVWGAFLLGAAVYGTVVATVAIIVFCCVRLVFRRRLELLHLRIYCTLMVGALVAGTATALGVADVSFLSPQSTRLAADLSVLWAGLGMVLSTALWIGGQKLEVRPGFLAVTVAAVLASAPVTLAVLPFASNRGSSVETEQKRPNVLIITADAMRADYCSVYGGSTPTPHLEALAARGALFQNFVTTAPWTSPSLDAMFSSKYPPGMISRSTGADFIHRNLAPYWCDAAGRTFVDEVGDTGTTTAVFAGNWRISKEFWLVEPFQHHVAFWPQNPERRGPFRRLPVLHAAVASFLPSLAYTRPLDTTRELTDHAVEFLRQHRDRPFFLWVHYFDPHAPYDPPARFRTKDGPWSQYPPTGKMHQSGLPPDDDQEPYEVRLKRLVETIEFTRSLYAGEIRYVDDALGRVLDELNRLGLEDDTIVCFSSDHGEELWDHDQWGHGFSLYQEQLHVPFIVAGPGIERQTIEARVSQIDFVPTLANLLGLDASPEWHGTSLVPLLRGDELGDVGRTCFAQGNDFPLAPEASQTVVSGRFKLIRGKESGRIELFDLVADPDEKTNVADQHAEVVQELVQQLDGWAAGFEPDLIPLLEKDTIEILPEEIEALRATGYLD